MQVRKECLSPCLLQRKMLTHNCEICRSGSGKDGMTRDRYPGRHEMHLLNTPCHFESYLL